MFKVDFEVRDNEVDIQGVVNNSNYMVYMAHARHKFLHSINIDFAEMARNKQNLFLLSSTIEFKNALKPNDLFYVTCRLIPEGRIKFAFEQEIRLASNDLLIAKGLNVGVCIDANNRNRPYIPDAILRVLPKTEAI